MGLNDIFAPPLVNPDGSIKMRNPKTGNVVNIRPVPVDSDPSNPAPGEAWYNSTEGRFKGRDATGVVYFVVSATP